MAQRCPTQPIIIAPDGCIRFRANVLVQYLLDHGGIDLNHLLRVPASDEDRAQFAQLIGYSVSGWGDLSCVAEGCRDWLDEVDAEAAALTEKLP